MSLATVRGAEQVTAPASANWELWSTTAHLLVTDAAALPEAVELARGLLDEVELAGSRFRADSELSRVNAAAVAGPVTRRIGPLFADLMRAALETARHSDGDVDPTVGAALCGLGYDRDYLRISADDRRARPVPPRARWDAVRLDGDVLHVPAGVVLDLGASAKAVAADRAAALVARRCDTGVLMNLGGDLATAGPAPAGGWQIEVRDRDDDPVTRVALPAGAALATSSTRSRTWRRGGLTLHHIVDPRTGASAEPVWRSVTVAAATCWEANALATAAIVRGRPAFDWLSGLGAPARLLTPDGAVRTTPSWPGDAR